ncbi:MAG: hypothetical protein E3J22_01480 [Candidatus Aminicenantes bacterium]|nr:MAG: hypothetical protein E3J22_01480 [Candidatus Aminicenantes bacterium]
MRSITLYFVLINLLVSGLFAQEEHTFDLSEIEKKVFQFGGYLEFRPVLFGLDRDSWLYKLRFYDLEEGETIAEYNFNALLDLSFEKGIVGAKIRTNTDITKSVSGWSHVTTLFEAFLSLKPSFSFHLDIGKKRMKWGKGYAWNPVAFIDRPKNPNDPGLALEGYVVLSIDYIKSFQGKLKTITFTPVLIPVNQHINSTFGNKNQLNFGGKVYFLFYDTDIDLMFLSGGSVPARYGMDFSRNITSNFEIHGEFAYIPDYIKEVIQEDGTVGEEQYASMNYLLGIRFLTRTNTTFFFEYFKNGNGYTSNEMENFYSLIDQAYQSYLLTGDDSQLEFLSGAASQAYRTFAPMQDYLFLRISHKEPWNILYFIPSFTSIFNLTDKSFSLTPELLYNPITNLELRAKITILLGKGGSEFGEKQNDFRLEFRGRYYF